MGTSNISEYMLELYNLNVVSPEERELIKTALASDAELRLRYEALERSDYEILQRYPVENMPTPAVLQDSDAPIRKTSLTRQGAFVKSQFSTKAKYRIVLGLTAAAAVLVCVFFISLYNLRNLRGRLTEIASVPNNETGWARGTENNIHDFSISLYPLDIKATLSQIEYENGLPDGIELKEGDSLLLAYTTPPEGEYEGVIFSVNGKSGTDVMPFFPADLRDRPKLSSGGEALRLKYVLDAAPDFEIFFLVASQNPMDAEMIIKTANGAIMGDSSIGESGRNLDTILERVYTVFAGYDVKHSYIYIAK